MARAAPGLQGTELAGRRAERPGAGSLPAPHLVAQQALLVVQRAASGKGERGTEGARDGAVRPVPPGEPAIPARE